MVDPWETYHNSYQRTAVVLDHFNREINELRGGVLTAEGMHCFELLYCHRFTHTSNGGIGEQRQVRVMLLAGSDLISTMSEPGVWSAADVNLLSLNSCVRWFTNGGSLNIFLGDMAPS